MAKKATDVKEQLEVGKIVKADELEFKSYKGQGSMYDSVLVAMAKLKRGGAFIVPCPAKLDVKVFQNRLNAVIRLRKGDLKAPEGCIFRKRTTVDGQVAICCIEGEPTVRKGKKKTVSKGEPAPHPQAT